MQKVRLLVGAHDHIILTILHEFNGLRLADIEGISQLLLASVHHTLLELVGDR